MGTDDAITEADRELRNWGRSYHDGWLGEHLLYANVPTSEGYLAPVVAWDDPEPAREPVDESLAAMTEAVVVAMGTEPGGFDNFRVLQHWYTRLMMLRSEGVYLTRAQSIKRLSKHMGTSFSGAARMLEAAQRRYWQKRIRRAA